MHALLVGVGLGAGVGAQIGPMSLIALVDGLHGGAGAAGVVPLLDIEPLRLVLGVLGAVVLQRAFLTALGATASNPWTIGSWAASPRSDQPEL